MSSNLSDTQFKAPQTSEEWIDLFIEACGSGDLEWVKQLCSPELKSIADIHAKDELGFRYACQEGHLEIVKFLTTSKELIKAGHSFVDLHAKDELGFRYACQEGHLEIVKFLTTSKDVIEAGHSFVDIHANDERGFQWACQNGHLEIVKFLTTSKDLLEAGHSFVNIHANVDDSFRWACEYTHWNVVQFLIFDLKFERTPIINTIVKKYPQAQEFFRIREEQEEIQQSLIESRSRLETSTSQDQKINSVASFRI